MSTHPPASVWDAPYARVRVDTRRPDEEPDVMLDHPTEWEKAESSGADAYTHMVTTLTTAGMFTPPVPAHLVASLNGVDWAWGTTTALEPFAVYFDAFAVLGECLDPAFGDFWLYGHRGHGVNSYGFVFRHL